MFYVLLVGTFFVEQKKIVLIFFLLGQVSDDILVIVGKYFFKRIIEVQVAFPGDPAAFITLKAAVGKKKIEQFFLFCQAWSGCAILPSAEGDSVDGFELPVVEGE